jgi:hypothetical protein
MPGKEYSGENERFYDANPRANGDRELVVSHDNQATRQLLQKHADHPSDSLQRLPAFARSGSRAEEKLARVMEDYRSHVEHDRIKIPFR